MDYNFRVDVFLTSGARADFEALGILPPPPGTWGLLVGHERGFRLYVERIFPVGATGVPSPALREAWDGILEGRLVGFFAFRPAASFRRAILGPGFYRQLYLEAAGPGKRPNLKAFAVDHKGRFFLSPLVLKSQPKGSKP